MTQTPDFSLLTERLKACAPQERGALLRAFWEDDQDCLFRVQTPGSQIATRLAENMDKVIRLLCELEESASFTVLAIGGYGQGRLAPYSDIDLLILTSSQKESEVPDFLYALWDMGVVPAQSIHSQGSALAAAEEEFDTRTAFLDARFLWGDQAVATQFMQAVDHLRARTIPDYFKAKLLEQSRRHEEVDNSAYAIEPDIKRGRGGIRDLQTLHWLGRYLEGLAPAPRKGLHFRDVLTPRELRRIRLLDDFFWSVRVYLHRELGRGDDKLYFGYQQDIAEHLGFRASGRVSQVERFTRYYFLAAQEASRLTGTAIRRLERIALGHADMPPGDAVELHEGIGSVHGQLVFLRDTLPAPMDVMELFHAAGSQNMPVHPEAFAAISRLSRRLNFRDLRTRPLASRFRTILEDSRKLEPVLRVMAETGFLGRMLPSFGAITGKAEYGLFRRYTLDDHILRSIAWLDRLCEGGSEVQGTAFLDQCLEMRPALAMALLLQEMPAAMVRPSPVRVRRRIEDRVGFLLGKEAATMVAMVVKNRHLLVRTATRRDLADPEVLRQVAAKLGSVEVLAFLSLFTLCRQREAGVGSWEEYTHRDVRLLVNLLNIQITGGDDAVSHFLAGRSTSLRNQVEAKTGPGRMAGFDALVAEAGSSFWTSVDVVAASRLATLIAETPPGGMGDCVLYTDEDGFLHLLLYSDDRLTLFAECAGIATMIGGSVFGARGFAFEHQGRHRGVIILQIQRTGTPPEPFHPDDIAVGGLAEKFRAVAQGRPPEIILPPRPVGDRRDVFDITPTIRIDEDASSDALIVEVEALDRPGLLYLLASHLSEIGVDATYALVATYGHRAVDTFYLRDHPGYKIEDPRRIETIRRQLLRALSDDAANASLLRTA
ncbi:MAG: hypothetical protein AAGA69_04425 [Pseudomonadota bacterium]